MLLNYQLVVTILYLSTIHIDFYKDAVDNFLNLTSCFKKLSTIQYQKNAYQQPYKFINFKESRYSVINNLDCPFINTPFLGYQQVSFEKLKTRKSYQHIHFNGFRKSDLYEEENERMLITFRNRLNHDFISRKISKNLDLSTVYTQVINSETHRSLNNDLGVFSDTLINNVDKYVVDNSEEIFTNKIVDNFFDFDFEMKKLSTLECEQTHFTENNKMNLLITELMLDPIPSIGLPNCEYIELYNHSEQNINLENYTLIIRDTYLELPTYNLPSKEYIILIPSSKTDLYTNTPHIGISKWKTLHNTEGEIILQERVTGESQDIYYTLENYKDTEKKNGGWSLEMINTDALCKEMTNWKASTSVLGGTPSAINSVSNNIEDHTAPKLTQFFFEDEYTLDLEFDEQIDFNISTPILNSYPKISDYKIVFDEDKPNSIKILLSEKLTTPYIYRLQILGIRDCFENSELQAFEIFLDEALPKGSIFITEILFNPKTNRSEFIEIYNASSENINLKNWVFRNQNEQSKILSEEDLILPSFTYMLFTNDILAMKDEYPLISDKYWIETSIPSLSNEGGSIQLLSPIGEIYDEISFHEKMHSELLKETKGISLEKINIEKREFSIDNWNSASASMNYATPAYQNSQAQQRISSECIEIAPLVFTPNGNGYKDILHLYISCEKNKSITLQVFNTEGKLIKTLGNNLWTPKELHLTWDGLNESGKLASIGRYLLLITFLSEDGNISTLQKNIVLSHAQ